MAAPHPLLLPLLTGEDIPPDATIDMDVVESAEEHWVAALIEGAVSEADVEVTPEASRRLTARALATKSEVEAYAATASRAVKTATSIGVDVAVFKGLSIGARFYDDHTSRPSVDVDIFVDPHQVDRLGEYAVALGADTEDRLALDVMVTEGRVFEISVTVDGVAVDIHRDPMNMIVLSRCEREVWDRTVALELPDGTKTRTLDLEDSLLQALLHLFRDNFADLLHVNDVRLLMDADPDWDILAHRADLEGWTDIIRYALWFVCDILERPTPMPAEIARWRKLLIRQVWPRDILLKGHASYARGLRRQSVLGLLVADDLRTTAEAYGRRLAPPRSVIETRSNSSNESYPVALLKWRMAQRREARTFRGAGGMQ